MTADLEDAKCCLQTPTHINGIGVIKCVRQADKERFLMRHSTEGASCAGRSIREILEDELDVVVERLKSGGEADDGRDPGRAEGLAMAIAIFYNPYFPDILQVKANAANRWKSLQAEEEVPVQTPGGVT